MPLGIGKIVHPGATLSTPSYRMRVHAEIVALRLEVSDPPRVLGQHMIRPAVYFRDLGIRAEIPAELGSGAAALGQARAQLLAEVEHCGIAVPGGRIYTRELEAVGLDVDAQERGDRPSRRQLRLVE
jgi:hypothetical protein